MIRTLRPVLLTLSALSLVLFLFSVLGIRQAWFLDEPLVEAAGRGDLARVRSLLAGGASPDAYAFDSTTALVYAANNGHREVVVLLLCSGANTTLRDREGQLPVDRARESGHQNVVELLTDPSMTFCRD